MNKLAITWEQKRSQEPERRESRPEQAEKTESPLKCKKYFQSPIIREYSRCTSPCSPCPQPGWMYWLQSLITSAAGVWDNPILAIQWLKLWDAGVIISVLDAQLWKERHRRGWTDLSEGVQALPEVLGLCSILPDARYTLFHVFGFCKISDNGDWTHILTKHSRWCFCTFKFEN